MFRLHMWGFFVDFQIIGNCCKIVVDAVVMLLFENFRILCRREGCFVDGVKIFKQPIAMLLYIYCYSAVDCYTIVNKRSFHYLLHQSCVMVWAVYRVFPNSSFFSRRLTFFFRFVASKATPGSPDFHIYHTTRKFPPLTSFQA